MTNTLPLTDLKLSLQGKKYFIRTFTTDNFGGHFWPTFVWFYLKLESIWYQLLVLLHKISVSLQCTLVTMPFSKALVITSLERISRPIDRFTKQQSNGRRRQICWQLYQSGYIVLYLMIRLCFDDIITDSWLFFNLSTQVFKFPALM